MCGRTCLSLAKDQVQCACSYKPKGRNSFIKPDWLPEHNAGKDYTPSQNIAPTDVTPVLVSASKYSNDNKLGRVLKPMMWGIIPPWHKGDYKNHRMSTNNCRIETIKESKLYSPILKNGGRCVIVAEGFYEWQTTKPAKVKQPYYIYSPQSGHKKIDDPATWDNSYDEASGWSGVLLLYMAGIYDVWRDEGSVVYAYSVITMESNDTLSWLHHRMPAILDTEQLLQAWLDIDNVDADMALSLLQPVKLLSWHKVSVAVNNSRNKSQDCNKEITKDKTSQKTLNAWFKPAMKRKSTDMDSPDTNIKDNKRLQ